MQASERVNMLKSNLKFSCWIVHSVHCTHTQTHSLEPIFTSKTAGNNNIAEQLNRTRKKGAHFHSTLYESSEK